MTARVQRGGIGPSRATTRVNTFQRRRFASQTKPRKECHPERSEGSLAGQRSFAALRACPERSEGMTKRDGLFFEMYRPLRSTWCGATPQPALSWCAQECLERVSVGGKGLILKHGSEDAHLEFSDLSVNPLQHLYILCQPEPQITRI